MNKIEIAGVSIDIHEGPLGISFSGGVDSSLLLYILMKHSVGPIHIFTCVADNKHRSSMLSSTSVLTKILDSTKNYNIFHHLHFVNSIENLEHLFEPQIDFIDRNVINILYTGITKNPPLDIQRNFQSISTENNHRHPAIHHNTYEKDFPIYKPFVNFNKKTIAKMYKELGLDISLLPYTRSCESPTDSQGHCGKCWWCEERIWAFDL